MKKEIMDIIEPIIDRSVDLIARDNEDEIVGVFMRLQKEALKNEDALLTLELNIIALMMQEKDK